MRRITATSTLLRKSRILRLCGLLTIECAATSHGEMVVQWWGTQKKCRHRTLTITLNPDGTRTLHYDLSAIPTGTRVYHASLRMSTDKPKLPVHSRAYMEPGYYDPLRIHGEFSVSKPILIYPLREGADGKPAPDETELKLEPPRFRSFDVTEVVQDWVPALEPGPPMSTKLPSGNSLSSTTAKSSARRLILRRYCCSSSAAKHSVQTVSSVVSASSQLTFSSARAAVWTDACGPRLTTIVVSA